MSKQSAIRWLAAFLAALSVSGTSYLCAYYHQRAFYGYFYGNSSVRFQLSKLQEGIEDYQKTTGQLPATLSKLDEKYMLRPNANGHPHDSWNHPYQFQVNGDEYILYSFGRDGQPGGEGLDADIYLGKPIEPPTFFQFTFELPTAILKIISLLSGICAGLICLCQPRKFSTVSLLIRFGVTALGAIIAAIMISIVHIPSGH